MIAKARELAKLNRMAALPMLAWAGAGQNATFKPEVQFAANLPLSGPMSGRFRVRFQSVDATTLLSVRTGGVFICRLKSQPIKSGAGSVPILCNFLDRA
jgi:hypothetical protein